MNENIIIENGTCSSMFHSVGNHRGRMKSKRNGKHMNYSSANKSWFSVESFIKLSDCKY